MEQVANFVKENFDWLDERITKDWSSRSGFMSFIKNHIGEFMENVYTSEPRYLSILLGYAIELENGNADMYEQLTDETLDAFYCSHSVGEFINVNNKENTSNDIGEETTETTADDIR